MNSVNSQRCRQLLDLWLGFKLSPLLWKHINTSKGLSADVFKVRYYDSQDHELK